MRISGLIEWMSEWMFDVIDLRVCVCVVSSYLIIFAVCYGFMAMSKRAYTYWKCAHNKEMGTTRKRLVVNTYSNRKTVCVIESEKEGEKERRNLSVSKLLVCVWVFFFGSSFNSSMIYTWIWKICDANDLFCVSNVKVMMALFSCSIFYYCLFCIRYCLLFSSRIFYT